jgi:hypothetical protein
VGPFWGNSGGPIQWELIPQEEKSFVHFLIHLLYTKLHASVVAAWLLFLVENRKFEMFPQNKYIYIEIIFYFL